MPDQDDDLYGDGDTMTAQAPAEKPDKDAGEEPTFLVSKSALMGKVPEVGETKKIRAVRVLGDQVEFVCTYPDKDKSEDEDEGEDMTDESPAPSSESDSDYE